MKPTFAGAAYSAAFCAVSFPIYFTLRFALAIGEHRVANVAVVFLNVAALGVIPAAVGGFVLGGIGDSCFAASRL